MINPGWLLCNQLCNYVNLYMYSFPKLNIFNSFLGIVILNLVKLTMYSSMSCHITSHSLPIVKFKSNENMGLVTKMSQ